MTKKGFPQIGALITAQPRGEKTGLFGYKVLLLALAAGLILTGWASANVEAPATLGNAPMLPQQAVPLSYVDAGDYIVYLPLVLSPPAPALWINTQDRSAVLALYQNDYLGSANTNTGWTGNHATCGAGTTSDEFRASILLRINFFRSMAGMPPLTGFDATYSQKAQAAALMMSVNRALSHSPDSSWLCYTEDGRTGAGSSNLCLGCYGPGAIAAYMYDGGSGNYAVGHRRWILYPQTQVMGTGDIPAQDGYPSSNALWVFDSVNMWGPRPETRDAYIAWPPRGYVPYPVVYPRWSFAYAKADFSQATVTMTKNGQPLAVQVLTQVNGYGENTLVWEPSDSFGAPAADVTYQVTVSNVLIDAQSQSFTYTVIVFNPGY